MGFSRKTTLAVIASCAALAPAPLTAAPLASAAPAKPSCAALGDVDEKIGDMQFDLNNLRLVMNNAYASIDIKKHDEEFRLKTMVNAFGYLGRTVDAVGDPGLSQQFEAVKPDYENMRNAVQGQFVVVQDGHYDFYSSTHYQSPRLTGTGDDPEAFGAIDTLDGDLQDLAGAVDSLRDQGGCPSPGDDETGPGNGAARRTRTSRCRFHPGSNQCDATGSILH